MMNTVAWRNRGNLSLSEIGGKGLSLPRGLDTSAVSSSLRIRIAVAREEPICVDMHSIWDFPDPVTV
jgi:hypothetical protein